MAGYYPLFLNIEDRVVIVIGGGTVALRKVEGLLRYMPSIRVISPAVDDALQDLADEGEIEIEQRDYVSGDLEGASLVFVATDDPELNKQVSEEAIRLRIPVNVVDQPALCDFICASTIRRGDLCIAISTGGTSPRLARRIREQLNADFGPEYAGLVKILGRLRNRIVQSSLSHGEKAAVIDEILESEILSMLREGNHTGAEKRAEEILRERGL